MAFPFSSRDSQLFGGMSSVPGTNRPTIGTLTYPNTDLERTTKSREKGERKAYLDLQRRMTKAKGSGLFIVKTKARFPNAIIRSRKT